MRKDKEIVPFTLLVLDVLHAVSRVQGRFCEGSNPSPAILNSTPPYNACCVCGHLEVSGRDASNRVRATVA